MRAGRPERPLESPETGLPDETSLAEGERPGFAHALRFPRHPLPPLDAATSPAGEHG
jgi:hypothetical protein